MIDDLFSVSPYLVFDRAKWSKLRADEPMTLSKEELETLKGINEIFSVDEVKELYLSLRRIILHPVG